MSQLANHFRIVCEIPKPGMGATIFHWTDRSPATVTRVSKSGKSAWVKMDRAVRIDKNGMSESQQYEYTPGDGKEIRVILCTDGQWKIKGEKVAFGFREKYHDFSF